MLQMIRIGSFGGVVVELCKRSSRKLNVFPLPDQKLAGIILSGSKVMDNMKRSLHRKLLRSSFDQLMLWWSGSALFGFLKLFLVRRSSLG
uniref:Uncharacterized protein n=1 Tax=Brassica oleracea TaxID=3712 RepID=A0A3P6CU33_BRAOL|nr:unnamed protein product [Brassica oleracea]